MQPRREQLAAFLFPADSDRWLFILRLGLGLQGVLYTLTSRADWHELFVKSGVGLVNRELADAVLSEQSLLVPRLGWLVCIGGHFGLDEATIRWSAWACLLCSACCLVAGILSR